MTVTPFKKSLQLLWTRRFGTFWFASLLANIGTWAQQVAQPWLMLSLGASSFLLGLDAFALGAPVFVLTLLGGRLADRMDRRRVITIFQSAQAMCPLLLVVLILTHTVTPWIVIVLSLVVGITDALSMPSFQTIVPTIVDHEEIPTGLALNSTQFNLSRILGPAIAGVLMASSAGVVGAFSVSAASYIPFILVALWILPRKQIDDSSSSNNHQKLLDPRSLLQSVRAVVAEPDLRKMLITVFVTSTFCAPLITFCPVLVKEVFHGGTNEFSLAVGVFGLGGLLGAIALLTLDTQRDRMPVSSLFAIAYASIVVFVALNPWPWGLPLAFVLAGVFMATSNISANTVLQSRAPEQLRGQTSSLFMLAMRGGISIGSLLTGATVTMFGVREALLINGLIAIVLQVTVSRS